MGGADEKNTSVRTCVGCSQEADPESMERFVFVEEMGLLHDARRKAPGRGAHVHPSVKCIEGAVKHGFNRGFRRKVEAPAPPDLVQMMYSGIERRVTDRLRAAIRGGEAFVGGREVEEGMKRDGIALLLIARDAGESTRKKFASNADRKDIGTEWATFDAAEIGALMGRDRVAVLGLTDRHAAQVELDLRKLAELRADEG